MSPEIQFRLFSYAAVFCGFLSLWISGTFGLFESIVVLGVFVVAWRSEETGWQIKERLGTVLIVLAIPVFYLLLQYRFFSFSSSETMLPGVLARLILALAAIKLLQRKSDRDWMFLYVMSFFQVLLAAGLSISIGYLVTFTAYIFVMAGTIILFEIRKTQRAVGQNIKISDTGSFIESLKTPRILTIATILIVVIGVFAVPTFFMLPRVGGAGFGGRGNEVSAIAGFSDTVRLGGIGRIQQNDEIVMRVRIDGDPPASIRWRGVALDTFEGQAWSKTKAALREPRTKSERDLIQLDLARRQEGLTLQTVYLEPLDTPVLFGLGRIIGVQGNFPLLYRDAHGSVTYQRTGERVSYKVISETSVPTEAVLRSDRVPYSVDFSNYLQRPSGLDPRIEELAATVTADSTNRYDAARTIESYLQTQVGYTLEQKAAGSDPLSDFLFNVREGHCEYFATAMAVMLRTQGVATRIVNGFQRGDYNETADVFVVRQRQAHSWVEVYFPETETWVEFDPTPFAGQTSDSSTAGFTGRFRKYMEALETFWIQYFVAFDNQEQRSLFVNIRRGISNSQSTIASAWNVMQAEIEAWWARVRGDEGFTSRMSAIGFAVLLAAGVSISLLFVGWLVRKAVKSKVWRRLWDRLFEPSHTSVIEFYERMLSVLASKGFDRAPHQTPLEFAYAVGFPKAIEITDKYNRVRFGEKELSRGEADEIESWLEEISTAETPRRKEETEN